MRLERNPEKGEERQEDPREAEEEIRRARPRAGQGCGQASGWDTFNPRPIYLIPEEPGEGVCVEAWEIELQGPPSSRSRGGGGQGT